MIKKIIIGCMLIVCFGLFTGCTIKEYGYKFHFYVDGGNGELNIDTSSYSNPNVHLCKDANMCQLECVEYSSIVALRGGKNGSRELTFIATPDEGYQVKEWLFNGKIVEGNNTNTYTAKVSSEQNYNGVVSVRFELIPNNN